MPRFHPRLPKVCHCVTRFSSRIIWIAGLSLLLMLWLSATASALQCQPPQSPSLTATATSFSKIRITWNVVASDNPNYQIFMSRTGVSGSFVHMGGSYAHPGVTSLTAEYGSFNANETAYFYVTAYGCNTSVPSNIASATTPDFGYPTLTATATTADFGHITLSWNVVDGASPTYQVYMSNTGASGSFVYMGDAYHGNPDVTTLTRRFGNFGPNQTRYFYVLAHNGNTSHQSNIVSATTPNIGYPVLKAQAANKTQINPDMGRGCSRLPHLSAVHG